MGSNITFFIYSGNESTDSGHHSGTAKKCVKTDSNSSSPIGKISDMVFCYETPTSRKNCSGDQENLFQIRV